MPPDIRTPAPTTAETETALRLGVSRESWERIASYIDLLAQWQRHTNLISNASMAHVWTRHVLDSLQLLPLLPKNVTAVADLGSGGGFPAIPLAIATGAHFHLYESIGKKVAFLREAAQHVQASTEVHHMRLEDVPRLPMMPKVQAVTARALAGLPELLRLAEPFIKNGAKAFFHKGSSCDAELTQAAKYWKIKAERHVSLTDSQAVILEVHEVTRV